MADLFTSDPPPWRVVLGPDDLPKFRRQKDSPITPGMPTKNAYRTVNPHTKRIVTRGGIRKALVKAMTAATWADTGRPLPRFECPVSLHLVQYYPRKYGKDSPAALRGLPALDSDACLEAVRDSIEQAGIVCDDALIVRNLTEVRYRKGEPGLEIEIRPL